ncbi:MULTISPECIES: right-handed parallel beta-helix repeat-containing protein [Clostridium]|uniref:Right-handed parallel beta-helix repeat-containing protein n=1 Tax=Clostridium frigoriphilum TaxID=443253 RepID=A0ABU7UT16_9CLOT|nr:right-handed parallel beta-helix repeat-containing protein [Clostridium sp. DSM 17811]MBU3100742.1 right-handed parallel beta-helix repeat-containing protein [Clostridium sp. DSM 17811]
MKNRVIAILSVLALTASISIGGVPLKANAATDIATLLEKGGTIPAGNYKLTRGVKVTKDIIANKVVIDASGCPNDTIAIVANASITGITINSPQRQGISIQDCSGKTLKNCTVTKAKFAGIEAKNNVSNILIEGCVSNNNYDPVNSGESADGFGIKNGAKDITLKNCSASSNSDDGYDTYTAGANITFIGCKAINSGSGGSGDGNGFKLGPNGSSGGLITVTGCTATNNKGWGFLRNHNKVTPKQSGNIATGNLKGSFSWILN